MNMPLCATFANLNICVARYEKGFGKLCRLAAGVVLYERDEEKIRELEKVRRSLNS